MALLAQLVDGVVVHKFELKSGGVSIGRTSSNDIVVDDGAVSGKHAKINCKPNPDFPEYQECFIEDLHSTNGTVLNGNDVTTAVKLNHNDQIKIAWNEFKFIDEGQESFERTVHMLKK